MLPDTTQLEGFAEVFGFTPPAEPLLEPVFAWDKGRPLSELVSWSASEDAVVVPPELLAAMKIRSLPDRDKSHKRVKDVADLHSLLWYIKDYSEMKDAAIDHVSERDLNRLESTVDENLFEDAAQLLQVDSQLINGSVQRLFR